MHVVAEREALVLLSRGDLRLMGLDAAKPVELGNVCRLLNFLGGQDEEHFSMVHVAIEARAGHSGGPKARLSPS